MPSEKLALKLMRVPDYMIDNEILDLLKRNKVFRAIKRKFGGVEDIADAYDGAIFGGTIAMDLTDEQAIAVAVKKQRWMKQVEQWQNYAGYTSLGSPFYIGMNIALKALNMGNLYPEIKKYLGKKVIERFK